MASKYANSESLDFESMQTLVDEKELSQSGNLDDFSVKSWREDMFLVVEDKKLYVASNVLSLMSPVFTTMFEEHFKEDGPKKIELHGKKYDEVTEFLRCLYPNILKTITQDNVFVVLPLADEFKVDRLKLECENVLLRGTHVGSSPDNIYKCLQQASLYNLDKLRIKAVEIAASMEKHKSGVEDGRNKLPLDVQLEIKNKQIENLNMTVSKLTIDNETLAEECQNLKDCVKHFWPDHLKKEEHQQCEVGVLVLPLPDVRTFTEDVESTGTYIHGIKWSIDIQKNKSENGEETVGVFLTADAPEDWQNWTCEVYYKVLLISSQSYDYNPMTKCSKQIFTQNGLSWGRNDFIKMKQLSDDKYVKDGSALIKAYLMVKHPWCKPVF